MQFFHRQPKYIFTIYTPLSHCRAGQEVKILKFTPFFIVFAGHIFTHSPPKHLIQTFHL